MFKKRLLELCNSSKKWIAMTVLMNWISIICNILVILFIGNTIDSLIKSELEINYLYRITFSNKILSKLLFNKILT